MEDGIHFRKRQGSRREFTTPFLRERKDWLSESTRETERESEGGGRRGGNYME